MEPTTIERNIFGKYKPYVSPIHTEEQLAQLEVVINGIGNHIQAQLSDDEFIKETSNINVVLQYLVSIVNQNLPAGITRVDGTSIKPIVKKVIKERVDAINAKMIEE